MCATIPSHVSQTCFADVIGLEVYCIHIGCLLAKAQSASLKISETKGVPVWGTYLWSWMHPLDHYVQSVRIAHVSF